MTIITTNKGAREWLRQASNVPRGTFDKLERFEAMLLRETERQNLISASTVDNLWARHFVDSAQLLVHAKRAGDGPWLDIGSGAGFPGLVIAILDPQRQIHLVESRALRCEFLARVGTDIGLDNVIIHHSRLETVSAFGASVISARAFAPLQKLLKVSQRFSTEKTLWLLPKGKNAVIELESVPKAWQRLFHVEHSVTDPDSHLLVGLGTVDLDHRKTRNR